MNTQLSNRPLLIVPGLGGSGDGHWQALWSARFEDAEQIVQDDWDNPDLSAWLTRLRAAIEKTPNAILVGHSLGCILIAHLAQRDPTVRIAGALLVAPADVDASANLPDCLATFAPVPRIRLPFPSITVASTNDPYATIGRADDFARSWGSIFRNVGACGHINIASGFGPWPEGERILADLGRVIAPHSPAPSTQHLPQQTNPIALRASR